MPNFVAMNKLIFQSFGSGSSGNCYYIGTYSRGILVDAGISARNIRLRLRALGLDFENIWGIFVTHDHADHVRAVGTLGEKFHIPVYATRLVREGIERNPCANPKPVNSYRPIEKKVELNIGDFCILPFGIAHDSTDCVGYHIRTNNTVITLATDVGATNDALAGFVKQSDMLIIEANFDDEMLDKGTYPAYLKQRIRSGTGHLSNEKCSSFLVENYHEKLKRIFLCHLSQENNRPELAYSIIGNKLAQAHNITIGDDVQLEVFPRREASKLFIIA